MELNNNHIIYTAQDISNYLQGKMPALEMNALEKAALDDPFLAEAIEGYEMLPEKDWSKQLAGLREQFNVNDLSATKVVSIKKSKNNWRKYAAAVLLIGAAATTYLIVNQQDKPTHPSQLAEVKADPVKLPAVSAIDSSPAATPSVSAEGKTASMDEAAQSKPLVAQQNIGTISRNDSSNFYARSEKNELKERLASNQIINETKYRDFNKDIKADSVAIASTSAPAKYAEEMTASNAAKASALAKSQLLKQENANLDNLAKKKTEEINRTFLAQVVGQDNNPLPFANINVTNQGFGTYADVKGNVRLVSTDSLIPVEVKSLGYGTQNIVLHSSNGTQVNKIVLKEDAMAVNDKIDFTKANARSRTAFIKYNPSQDSAANAEPADGWDNYNTYVLNNTELPDEVLTKNVHGEVEVSFDVKRNGSISNVKVDKSLCGDCDEIARRLVEQGPQWKIKKGRKAKGKIKVQF